MTLWIALALVGCGPDRTVDPDPDKPRPPPPPSARAAAEPEPPEPPAASVGRPTTGEPHFVAAEPRMPEMRDAFTFWGWSDDGLRYAFQTYMPGEGGVSCDRVHDLWVVDATTDAFVDEGHLQLGFDWPEGGPDGCQPRDLPGREAAARSAFLTHHGITVGQVVSPQPFVAGADGTWTAGGVAFTFQVLHGTDEAYGDAAQAGASYALGLVTSDGARVLESGERRRSYVLDYRPVLLFPNPQGTHAAVIIQREHSGFEGTRWSWMSNGLALP